MKIDHKYKGEIMNPRKKQILDAAHHLFVKNGFTATSIQDILDEAQIAKGTFYNHFSSKNECLISILNNIHDEAWAIRQELSIGKPKNDQEVFIKQIIVRMEMNKEHNLFSLFESMMHSNDDELKTYIRSQHVKELNWATERMIDLYGEKAKDHALDFAIILFGMFHHFIHVRKLGSTNGFDLECLIRAALKRLNILYQHQEELKPYFSYDWLTSSKNATETKDDIKEKLIFQIERLSSHMIKENDFPKKNGLYPISSFRM